jgi:hypothetical protein
MPRQVVEMKKGESATMEGNCSRLARQLRGKRSDAWSLTGEEETNAIHWERQMLRGRLRRIKPP